MIKKEELAVKHKKFDVLRATLLVNSIIIKEKCGDKYNDVVYFYKYNDPDIDTRARQNVISKLLNELEELKEKLSKTNTNEEILAEADNITAFLRNWLINHVLNEDLLLKPYLEKHPKAFS